DGGAVIRLDDDYCDDGIDESSTPACSSGGNRQTFRCRETGPLAMEVPASRVWDGICDCCDGSDERDAPWGIPPCVATASCGAAIAAAQEKARQRYKTVLEGAQRREAVAAEAAVTVAVWEAAAADLPVDAAGLTKLAVQLKVYLHQEERLERQERITLAAAAAESEEDDTDTGGGGGGDSAVALDAMRVERERAKVRAKRTRQARNKEQRRARRSGSSGGSGGGGKSGG
ncbi:unnamed protein product, partial [Phaeothamnion confervicola]